MVCRSAKIGAICLGIPSREKLNDGRKQDTAHWGFWGVSPPRIRIFRGLWRMLGTKGFRIAIATNATKLRLHHFTDALFGLWIDPYYDFDAWTYRGAGRPVDAGAR